MSKEELMTRKNVSDLKIYYTNLSPNDYEVKVENGNIIILPN